MMQIAETTCAHHPVGLGVSMDGRIHYFLLGRFERRELLHHLALTRDEDAVRERMISGK
jgi:hypothetical protein